MRCVESNQRYVALDVETTGLFPRNGDRVIEIGAIAIEERRIVAEFSSLIHVDKEIPWYVRQINGITNKMLIGRPKPEEVMPEFHNFIRNSILVAHNAQFDIKFLQYEFGRLGLGLNNRHVCTLKISRKHYPQLSNHRLETVFKHLCGELDEDMQTHRALSDARMVARIWLEMLKR